MPPANANARAVRRSATDLLADYETHLARTGRGNIGYTRAARSFLKRWPLPQSWASEPLGDRLAEGAQTSSFLMFLMVYGYLRPGYDYLVARRPSSFWRDAQGTPLGDEMARFRQAA